MNRTVKDLRAPFCMVKLPKLALVLVLALFVCLAFAATAHAKYGGFSPINPLLSSDPTFVSEPGYISFGLASAVMEANNVRADLQASAHGGYITTTTKCAVCHSAHRATGIPDTSSTPAGPTNQYYLTAGGSACTNCHATWGPTASGILVEWGQPIGSQSAGGPHVSGSNSGCTTCHKGGIHGAGTSEFYVMNTFMLGGDNDAQIVAEAEQLVLGSGALWVPASLTGGTDMNSIGKSRGNTWWYDGGVSVSPYTPIGGPPAVGDLPGIRDGNIAEVSPINYSAARSVATSYTCSQTGCHVNTVMANLQWGVGFDREITGETGVTDQATGHVLPAFGRNANNSNYRGNNAVPRCGPCHVGAPAGFPADADTGNNAISRLAYGCDQCHDMIGVATNSTAWPHGNRGILVYEWVDSVDTTGTRTFERVETSIASGNLWMYGGNIARAQGSGVSSTAYTSFADANWQVLLGVTSGSNPRTGTPTGGAPQTLAAAQAGAATNPGFGGMVDGSCMKCHIATDSASLDALGAQAAAATFGHTFNGTGWPGGTSNSQRLYLYR